MTKSIVAGGGTDLFESVFSQASLIAAGKVFGIELAAFGTFGEVIAEFRSRKTISFEVTLTVLIDMRQSPFVNSATGGVGKIVETATDTAEDSVGHLEKWDREAERHHLNSEAEKNTEEAAFSRVDDGEAGKFGSIKEEAEHGVEEDHLGKGVFPAVEPTFGIGEEVTNKGERGNHDKDEDDTLAKTDGDDANTERNNTAE